jgi:RES domain-containing protein
MNFSSGPSLLDRRLRTLEDIGFQTFKGFLYRYIHPRYSSTNHIVSGDGGLHASGRWNLKGVFRVSYTSASPETALAEALAHVRYYRLPMFIALPRVLVALRADLNRVLNLTHGHVRQRLKLSERTIRSLDWRKANQRKCEAETRI